MFRAADHEFMARALALAERGLLTTTPNPRVGCVLVRDGVIVGEGWHLRAGEPHAEAHALLAAGDTAKGATAYVTLEPCSHHGRTPPCCEALQAAGVVRVIAAMQDPNPLVAGQGLAWLRDAGVETAVGLMETEARELNIGFVSRMARGRPWLRLKAAISLDGRTALTNGESQWITGPDARRDGHRWRARACAILTGIGTVRDDDPQLNVREVETSRQPLRVVVDSHLEMRPDARILQGGGRVLVVAAVDDALQAHVLESAGAEVICLPNDAGKVDLWTTDRYHASAYGYYLEALTVFGAVTGRDPRSLGDGECSGYELGFSRPQVKALQQVAFDQLAAEGRVAAAPLLTPANPRRCAAGR